MAEEPLAYTQYDTDPPLECDLEEKAPDGTWGPMDLSGKTVRLLAMNRRTKRMFGGSVIVVSVAPVTGVPTPTRVRYVLQPDDLRDAGPYVYQWEALALNGAVRTVPPGDSWFEFEVARKLGVVSTTPVTPMFAGIDGTGPWLDGTIDSDAGGVDGSGPWIDGTVSSQLVGVDGTGPWIDA